MSKKLNTDQIKSELQGSAFFPAKQQGVKEPDQIKTEEPNIRTVKTNGVTERVNRTVNASILDDVRKGKALDEPRKVKRFSFEIYEDQIPRLEELQFRYKRKTGKRLSTSRFMREAIEQYLAELKDI